MLTGGADVPEMGHDAKGPFAELLPEVYFAGARCVGSCGGPGSGVRETKVIEEALGSCRALTEHIDSVGVRGGRHVMLWDDDLKGDGVLHRDNDVCHLVGDEVAADNPPEMPAHTFPPAIVSDLGAQERAQVLDDESPLLIERQAEVRVGHALGVQNDITTAVRSEDQSPVGSRDVAEPDLEARLVVKGRGSLVFWWLGRPSLATAAQGSGALESGRSVTRAGRDSFQHFLASMVMGVQVGDDIRVFHVAACLEGGRKAHESG